MGRREELEKRVKILEEKVDHLSTVSFNPTFVHVDDIEQGVAQEVAKQTAPLQEDMRKLKRLLNRAVIWEKEKPFRELYGH